MKTSLIAAFAGGAMMVLTIPSISLAANNNNNYAPPPSGVNAETGTAPMAAAVPTKVTPNYLINAASRINQEEEHMMGLAHNKAGSNQALKSMATMINDDHKANQNALKALAREENVNLNNNNNSNNNPTYNRLKNLKGAAFNEAFLNSQIMDHEKALRIFEDAKNQPESRAMRVYIGQTIPMLRAHLEMARNMKNDMLAMGSPENPANNKNNNGNSNEGNAGGGNGAYANNGGGNGAGR